MALSVAGPVRVDVYEVTLRPGGTTGPHRHNGEVIGVVTAGALTHYAPVHPGGIRVYAAGEVVREGSGYRHEGVNEGTEDLVMWVIYVSPRGLPLTEACDAP
ncbi:cupin domain-containing protein [Streptomyces sp. cg36]|uniref:cupin domain-containing protein n=1 Tax=Streptomyces sp. cg36 TaxID=3238798 RepID=UPI0034E2E24E